MAQKWLSASDPFFAQYPGTYDESGYVSGPYDSQVAGLQSPQNWEAVAPQLGWTGPIRSNYIGPDGNVMEDYSPEFLNWIQSKRAEGYDFVTDASQINKDRQTIGFRLPTGEVTNQRTAKVGGFGDFFKEFVLPAVGAYFGAGALGNALAPVTSALTGAAGPGAIAAGGALEGLGAVSGNIVGASGVPIAPAVSAPLIQDMAGNVLNAVTGDVIVPAAASGAGTAPITMAEAAKIPSNVLAGGDAASAASEAAAGTVETSVGAGTGQATEAAISPYSLSSGTTSGTTGITPGAGGTTGITPGAGGTTGITPVTTTPLGAAAGTAVDLAPALGTTLGATASALPVGSSLGATTSALSGAGSSASSLLTPQVIGGAANLIGGIASAGAAEDAASMQSSAAVEAAKIQADAAKEVARLQIEAADRAYERAAAERKPLQDIGLAALRRIETGVAPGGEFVRPFEMGDILGSERYKTLLESGRGALEQSAFSRGMGLSTPTAMNVMEFGQKLGVSELDRTRAQLQAEREAVLKPLQSLSGIGITESRALGDIAYETALLAGQAGAGAAGATGTTAANALLSGAGSAAAGRVQAGNIIGQTISGIGNQALQMEYLRRLFGGSNVPIPMGG
jgi:hypothetical protein